MIFCAYNFQEKAFKTVYDAMKFDNNPASSAAEKAGSGNQGRTADNCSTATVAELQACACELKNLSQIIDIYLIETAGCPPSEWEETIWNNSMSGDNVCLLSVSMCLEIIHRALGIPVW